MTEPTRVLVVEDEPGIVESVAYALRREGFESTACATAGEALARIGRVAFDLIVLDVGLPDRSGFELCRAIRAFSDVPILFLTARSEEIDRIVGLEIGGDDYVTKPFSPRELAARVKAILRRRRPRSEPPTDAPATRDASPAADAESMAGSSPVPGAASNPSSSPFVLDEKRFRVSYFDQPLDLTRCEFRLLCALVERPGWVFSRSRLLDLAWEEPDASLERTVDTHVKTLRAKLRAIRPDIDPIRTHRGLGYSLKEDW